MASVIMGFSDNPIADNATVACSVTVELDGFSFLDADLYELATRIGFSEIVQKACGEPASVYVNTVMLTGLTRQTYPVVA